MASASGKNDPSTSHTPTSDSEEEYEGFLGGKWIRSRRKNKNSFMSGKYVCAGGSKKCGQKVNDGDNGITCSVCDKWYHAECQNVTLAAYYALMKYDEWLDWICQRCKGELKKNKLPNSSQKLFEQLKEEIQRQTCIIKQTREENSKLIQHIGETQERKSEKLTQEVERLKNLVSEGNAFINEHKTKTSDEGKVTYAEMANRMGKEMSDMCERMERGSTEVDKRIINMEQNVVKHIKEQNEKIEASTKTIEKVAENRDREDRAANLIIHNVDESQASSTEERIQHDKDVFRSMARGLGQEVRDSDIERIIRLNRKDSSTDKAKPRLILVKLKSIELADSIFRRRMALKDAGFPNKYITRDKSPAERLQLRRLRAQLLDKGTATHMIFRNKVVPRDQRHKLPNH